MFTSLFRIIKYGFQDFVRHAWLSGATIFILCLTLLIIQGLIIFNLITNTTISVLKNKVDIAAYFKLDISEDKILHIKSELEKLKEVKSVKYISKEQALSEFKAKHKKDEDIKKALEELGKNPLPASLNIKAFEPGQYKDIVNFLQKDKFSNLIDHTTFSDTRPAINKLIKITKTIKDGGIGLTIIFALVAFLVSFNTIRLAIYSDREKIEIMRLVGSSNNFIRGPFIIVGAIYGIMSGILSFAIFAPAVSFLSPHISSFISEINLQSFIENYFFPLLLSQIFIGILMGVISSFFAVRRYLKV